MVYDTFVKPHLNVLNYHTQFSGITQELLENITTRLVEVQDKLCTLWNSKTVLLGHRLTNDLRTLRIVHDRIIDTSVLFPHVRGYPFKRKLKDLVLELLGNVIQNNGESGHDSAEDARADLYLFQEKLKKGPTFGLDPEVACPLAVHALSSLPSGYDFHCLGMAAENTSKPWQCAARKTARDVFASPNCTTSQFATVPSLTAAALQLVQTPGRKCIWLEPERRVVDTRME